MNKKTAAIQAYLKEKGNNVCAVAELEGDELTTAVFGCNVQTER